MWEMRSAAFQGRSFVIILLIMALLRSVLTNPCVQAVLMGMKPAIIGIILATGISLMVRGCLGTPQSPAPDVTALGLTIALAGVYFGSRRIMKKGLSPIALIGVSAAAGILAYGYIP